MNNFKLLHETPDHFVLHNGRASFHIAKNGISEPTADKIRSFANGGKTVAGDITQKENQKNMAAIDKKIGNYAEGGEAEEQKESFKLEEPAQTNLDEVYKPTELPEPEKQEKRRQIEVEMPEPTAYAQGGKLTAEDRKHIAPKNFAGPDKSYPIEDASHARNALARVSQHGSPELKAQVKAKVHAKYPGIEQSMDDGGTVDPTQTFQDSFRKATHYATGGLTGNQQSEQSIEDAANNPQHPEPTPTPDEDAARQAKYAAIRAKNSENMTTGNYAAGGSIANETQTQAIKRYADGNPATLSKGGHIHNNGGKNQLHFHFYDGATIPTPLDKEEGAGPQQSSPLDKYVNMAEGGDPAPMQLDAKDLSDTVNVPGAQPLNPDITKDIDAAATANAPQDSVTSASTVPQAQQIPAVPKALSATPEQSPTLLSDFDKNLALESKGIQQGADAQTQGYKDTAQAIGQNVIQQKQQMDDYKIASDALTKQNTDLFNAVASSKIDPDHYWNSKSTGGKIMATIGILLGGIAGGLNGTNVNQGLTTLQNHIQQDIEAQKNDQSNKTNLYKIGLQRYRDGQSAQQFATLQSNALLQGQLQKVAAQTGSQTAQATANQLIGQLGVQNTGLRADLAMKQAAFGAMNQPQSAQAGVDPNKMRLLINAGVIPKEEVPAAMKEYGDYQKLSTVLDDTDKTFDIGRKNANWRQAILPHWTPDITQSSKQYDAAIDNFLGKITKETEGRVTPADVELMRPSMPSFIDNPETAQQKLNTIRDQIKEKYAFPTLQSYRLLSPHSNTTTSSATRKKQFSESKPQ